MRIPPALLFLAPLTLLSSGASAQVLVTEVQANPISGPDNDEWVEIQNTGTASVSLDGWSLHDYVGNTNPTNESDTRWTFPAGSWIDAGEVIVVARQALAFSDSLGEIATWELASGNDDPNVPNLMPVGGNNSIQLSNAGTGDAVVLEDDQGSIVSYVEWGSLDRSVPGLPFTAIAPEGESLVRIDTTGSSAQDFVIAVTPTPFVGFMSSATLIVNTTVAPRHAIYGRPYDVTTTVMDSDGINTVDIYFSTATSSSGNAVMNYIPTTMTSSGSTYTFGSTEVNNLGAGLDFPEPASFHERYLRFFILAEDNNLDLTSEPPGADEGANNASYLPSYVQNVLPTTPTPISEAREPVAEDVPAWIGHSVRVRGVALIGPHVMDPARTLFTLQDSSNAAIAYFSTSSTAPAFSEGDELVVTGSINAFRGSTQLEEGDIELTGATGTVPEVNLTLEQIIADGEQYEEQLVKIDDIDFVAPRATWPSDPNDLGSWNVPITDGTNQVTLRVTTGADIFGQAAPQYGFDVRGVLNERDGQWQIFPRGAGDISAHPMPPPTDGGVVGMDGSTGGPDGGGNRPDAGSGSDAGTSNPDEGGCGCTSTPGPAHGGGAVFGLLLLGLFFFRRRN